MIYLADKNECTGCTACENICPKKCITMKEDVEGFLQPKIDYTNCIECRLCISTCPVLQHKTETKNKKTQLYAAYAKSKEILNISSSGGIFPIISKFVLEQNGVVYGATMLPDGEVSHIKVENTNDLYNIVGSKYVQSNLHNTFSQIKEDLDKNIFVLFCGSPCQVIGLLNYLKKDYSNLFTIDFVCHGVPSPKAWRYYLKENKIKNIMNVNFREKQNGWENFNLKINCKDKTLLESKEINIFMKSFLHNLNLRKCCYQCKSRGINRNSDITLGDLWGCKEIVPNFYNKDGVSLMMIHSDKGLYLFDSIRNDIVQLKLNKIY